MRRLAVFIGSLLLLVSGQARAQRRITGRIDEHLLHTLAGNTHPLARAAFDQGMASADLPMQRMLLVLSRSDAQEAALKRLLDQQQDKSSPMYHSWLTPTEFGEQFGAADEDIQAISSWLESQGFTVDRVANGKDVIEFSGTAGQLQDAFHTEIHKYVVGGTEHWANATDPQIPEALAPIIKGIVTLHNFGKRPQLIKSNQRFEAGPEFTGSGGVYALGPADYATIYNINPLYSAGIDGTGTTIAVVGRSNINVTDINQFRSTFGLSNNPPQVVVNGTDPGDLGKSEEAEAVLDTTWSGAVAPGATIKLVVSATTNASDGVDLSEEYIIDNNLGDVMTESFGDCEANYSQGEASFYSSLAARAAAQGITYAVAAGDAGAEGCDDPSEGSATGAISVNILAATPYTIAVGGTEFHEGANSSLYWNSTNGTGRESALSYIPEYVWNESCTAGTCTQGNSPGLWAGGGGVSTFYTRPSWQTGVWGIPSSGGRSVPDVALTAAGHDAYLLCLDGSCTPSARGRISFPGYSGTSAATPSFAGIMALVVQATGSRQGQADYVLYSLAAGEKLSACNGSNTSGLPASNCIFNDITIGSNAVPGEAGYGTGGAAYQAGFGYDRTTGLGSVNTTNLVNSWNGAAVRLSQLRIVIDVPNASNSTVMGLVTFSGWAIDDAGTVEHVAVAIDGVPYGLAAYGSKRTDVCQVYPGRAGCPNVGWSWALDTTGIADGSHTVDVTATSTSGRTYTVSSNFTVANWTTSDPITVDIDAPGSQSGSFSGVANFTGWAVGSLAGITQVAVLIDGVFFGNAGYGGNRPDVCAVYSNAPGCPNVGWNIAVDTTKLADGSHSFAITATSAGGQHSTAGTTFTVSNANDNPFTIVIDRPNAQSSAFSGPASFGGWATSRVGSIGQIGITIDGLSYGNALYGGKRPDVCLLYTSAAGCPNVGWSFVVDTTRLANGTHTLEITAYANSSGQQQTATVSSSFTVANVTAGGPMKVIIDRPNTEASTLIGLAVFSGWTLDDNGPVQEVEISVDGGTPEKATYGVNRPDVCNVYAGRAGCPNVGWSYLLDTSLIPDGTHTLAVTGMSSSGDITTASASFTVANWTTANPMKISIDAPNAQSGALSGVVAIGGWALDDDAAIGSVGVYVDGVLFGAAAYGANRPDVCAVYSGRAGCPNVGWNFGLDTTRLADGAHTLAVTGVSAGGQRSTVTTGFTVSNATGNPIIISIDGPASGGTLSEVSGLGGWALDTTAGVAIASVQVLVDGVAYGTAAYGGSRPDVCTVYTRGSGCPNVGWNFILDTRQFANGNHELDVQAVTSTGQQRTVSTLFKISNLP